MVCRREAPTVVEAANIGEFAVVGVGGRGNLSTYEKAVSDLGIGLFPNISDNGEIWNRFGVYAQPALVVVTTEGNVMGHMGTLSLDEIRDLVRRAQEL
tara:strand:- start:85 stop:378 length:294 start_codon:yes stop_codon:yes gene_type:complete